MPRAAASVGPEISSWTTVDPLVAGRRCLGMLQHPSAVADAVLSVGSRQPSLLVRRRVVERGSQERKADRDRAPEQLVVDPVVVMHDEIAVARRLAPDS